MADHDLIGEDLTPVTTAPVPGDDDRPLVVATTVRHFMPDNAHHVHSQCKTLSCIWIPSDCTWNLLCR